MNGDYTNFLHNFFDKLIRKNNENEIFHTENILWQPFEKNIFTMVGLQQNENNLWPKINDTFMAFFPIGETQKARRYAIPVEVNGHDADIIVCNEKILGIRRNSGNVFQKGHEPIEAGDEISFYLLQYDFDTLRESLKKTEPFVVENPLKITRHEAPANFAHGFRHTDIFHNTLYTKPV
jgi:hypothetical protein